LLASRWLYIAFASSTVLFGVVIATLRLPRTSAVDVRVAILATTAVAALVFDRVLTHKPLDCSSAPQLCRTYRERLFIHVAFAQSVALIAFLVQVGGGPKWLYLFGALCSEAELWTGHAPTRRALALDQARLDAAGCDLSLVAALRTTMPPRPGR
jgi:F0F1-type ATP synthase membrane subunit c/vacuolar-type H+-ATPase subunit K